MPWSAREAAKILQVTFQHGLRAGPDEEEQAFPDGTFGGMAKCVTGTFAGSHPDLGGADGE